MFVGMNRLLLVLLVLSCVKLYLNKKEIQRLNIASGEATQTIAQYKATIASLSTQKAHTDEIAKEMYQRIDENNKAARMSLQKVLKQSLPKDCKSSVEYLRNEVKDVKFD